MFRLNDTTSLAPPHQKRTLLAQQGLILTNTGYLSIVQEACAPPVDWRLVPGLIMNCPEALDLFNKVWAMQLASATYGDFSAGEILDIISLRSVDEYDEIDVERLDRCRKQVEQHFPKGLKNLSQITFLTPSEHGKHLKGAGNSTGKNISYFHKNFTADDLAYLFWSWFGAILMPTDETHWDDRRLNFEFEVDHIWKVFLEGGQMRGALNANRLIGECVSGPTNYIALDVDLGGGRIVHAYPVTEIEAKKIMAPVHVPTVFFETK